MGATEQFEPEVAAWRPDGIGPDGKEHGYYASGNGFSYYFERPSYQDGVVDVYVENLKVLYAGLYNPGTFVVASYLWLSLTNIRWQRILKYFCSRALFCFRMEWDFLIDLWHISIYTIGC